MARIGAQPTEPGEPHVSAAVTGAQQPRAESVPEKIARRLRTRIIRNHLPDGHYLGSEPELMAQFQASRGALREALRLLEHLSIAKMSRGNGGGLRVTTPHSRNVARVLAGQLALSRATPDDLARAGEAVAVHVTGVAARSPSDNRHKVARRFAEAAAPNLQDRYRLLSSIAQDKASEFFLSLQADLQPPTSDGALCDPASREQFRWLLEAITAGSVHNARRATLRWLRAARALPPS